MAGMFSIPSDNVDLFVANQIRHIWDRDWRNLPSWEQERTSRYNEVGNNLNLSFDAGEDKANTNNRNGEESYERISLGNEQGEGERTSEGSSSDSTGYRTNKEDFEGRGTDSGRSGNVRTRGDTLGELERERLQEAKGNVRAELVKKYAIAQYHQKGGEAADLFEVSNAELFHNIIRDFVEKNDSAKSVAVHTIEEYSKMRLFLDKDGIDDSQKSIKASRLDKKLFSC